MYNIYINIYSIYRYMFDVSKKVFSYAELFYKILG